MRRAPLLRAAWALVGSVALCGAAAPFDPPKRKPTPPGEWRDRVAGTGQVRYLTSARVYLDRGKREGLEIGHRLLIVHDGAPVTECLVEWVSDHNATCTAAKGAQVGDAFVLPPPPPVEEQPLPPELLSEEEFRRRKSLVEGTSLDPVAFEGETGLVHSQPWIASARLRHESHLATASRSGNFQQEQLELSLHGAQVLRNLRAYANLGVTYWTRPEEFQALQKSATQLHVRWAELAYERADSPLAFGGGRSRPSMAPGLFSLDGLYLRWGKPEEHRAFGAFAGTLPDPVTLAPTLSRPTAGVFFSDRYEGSAIRLLEPEARLAWVSTPELGDRLEAEAELHAQGGARWDAHAQLRFGLGEVHAPGFLDEARLDFGLRPTDRLRFGGGLRYTGVDTWALSPLDVEVRALHASATAEWALLQWLSLGAHGGLSNALEDELDRSWIAAQVGLPRLFKEHGGISASFQLERGWLPGRILAVQANYHPGEKLRLFARASLSWAGGANPEEPTAQEAGLYVSADYPLTSWLSVGGSLLGQIEFPPMQKLPDRRAPAPAALKASLQLSGAL